MASVTFDGVSKVYDNGFKAVDTLDLQIRDGEFMVLVGPSGCGKTTALRMLAGLEDISDGELVIDDTVVNDVAPQKRDIAMVFQNYALYPHLSVYDNMAYGLKIQKLSKSEIKQRVGEIAKVIGLEDLLERKPKALSGGQRQRVAMGRAIVRRPKVFLMDEPSEQPRREAARPDALGGRAHPARAEGDDRLRHPRPGRGDDDGRPRRADAPRRAAAGRHADEALQRAGQPVRGELHRQPGDEPLRGPAEPQERQPGGHSRRPVPAPRGAGRPTELERYIGRKVAIGIRPEHLEDAAVAADAPSERRLHATVKTVEALGAELIAHLEIAGRPVMTDEVKEIAADLDDSMLTELEAEAHDTKLPLVGRFDVASRARTGDRIEVVVDTSHVHYFDLDSGAPSAASVAMV